MIKTIIFDFGNVFINLDIQGALKKTYSTLNIDKFSEEMININALYEQGLISTEEFIDFYSQNYPNVSRRKLIDLWNDLLRDFPKHRLDFLKALKSASKYRLILLSNTNELHINWIKTHITFYEDFKMCFDQFYLSHEIKLRKPNANIYEFVLRENRLSSDECIFIDDNKSNIDTADGLGFNTWHINSETEDVVNLFQTKSIII